MSFGEIKALIGVSKGTLSGWLRNYPLTDEQILRLKNEKHKHVEKIRNTKTKNRQIKLRQIYERAVEKVGKMSDRDIFIAGLFLYWGEGGKTGGIICMSNTDPGVLKLHLRWLKVLGVDQEKLRIVLHLYADMDTETQTNYWSKELGVSKSQFRKPYVKKSNLLGLSYKNGFGQGTCMIRYFNVELFNFVMESIRYIKENL